MLRRQLLFGLAHYSRFVRFRPSGFFSGERNLRQSRFLASWMDFFIQATDAPYEYGLASGLSCLSTVSLGRKWLDAGRGVRPNLYLMLTGPSSVARKSTSVQFAQDAIRAVEPSFVGPSNYTMEGLLKWMSPAKGEQRNRLCIFSEEFGADLARRQAYAETMDADFCSLYDGTDFTKVRAKSETIHIERPRVSLFAACAYPLLERYLRADDWHSGFLMRFIFVAPRHMRPAYDPQPKFPDFAWQSAMERLAWIRAVCEANRGPMVLSPEAQALYEAATATIRQTIVDADHHLVIGTYLGRFGVNVLKLAMLYQLDTEPLAPVGVAAMEDAVNWAMTYVWPGFLKTYEVTTTRDFDAVMKRVVGYLKAPGGILKTDLAQLFMGSKALHDVLRHLQAGGLVRTIEAEDGTRFQWFTDTHLIAHLAK